MLYVELYFSDLKQKLSSQKLHLNFSSLPSHTKHVEKKNKKKWVNPALIYA